MADSATVTAAQIARLAGVGRAAVSNWRKRYDDFPQPVGGTLTSPTFALAEVETWLRAEGKIAEVDAADRLWHELDASRHPDESLAEALARVGLFLQLLDEHPDRWSSLQPLDDACVRTALAEDVSSCAATLPSPPKNPPAVAQIPSLRLAAELVAQTAGATPGSTVFFDLLDRYRNATGRQVSATPTQLADLMASLSPHGTTLDPACGLGTLLHAVRRNVDTVILGQDSDPALANLAAIQLRSMSWTATIRVGDSFADQAGSDGRPGTAFADQPVDSVLCDPPFHERGWNPDEYAYDSRFDYGLPPRTEPELAWVQLCLSKVRPGGTVLILLPVGAGSRPAGRRIRAELIRRGALREVVGLPAGHLSYKASPTQLWLLRRPSDDTPGPRQVLLIDVPPDREPGEVTEVVLDAHHRFAKDPASVDMPGVARSVPAIQLLDDIVDVTPARWVAAPDPQLNVADVQASFRHLTEMVNAAQTSGYEFVPGSGAPPTVTVGELSSRRAVEIIIAPLRATASGGGDEPMLLAADVVAGRDASGTATAEDGAPRTAAGDIVLPMLAETLSPRVLEQGGALLGPQLVLIRLAPQALDPWFVAGFLATPGNARLANSQSSIHRVDVKRARLPRLPIEVQRRYGDHFRRLSRLHHTLASAAALTADLAKQSAAALTAGTIDLPQ